MDFKLKKDYNRNGKILKAGQVLQVTEEMWNWLSENGYDKKEKKSKKKDSKDESKQI
tara:strand:- start:964 stop:1134 length:171 start_codon:yes stop_codon:yes gene_type:complete